MHSEPCGLGEGGNDAPVLLRLRLDQIIQVGQEVAPLSHGHDVGRRDGGMELREGSHCCLTVPLVQPGQEDRSSTLHHHHHRGDGAGGISAALTCAGEPEEGGRSMAAAPSESAVTSAGRLAGTPPAPWRPESHLQAGAHEK